MNCCVKSSTWSGCSSRAEKPAINRSLLTGKDCVEICSTLPISPNPRKPPSISPRRSSGMDPLRFPGSSVICAPRWNPSAGPSEKCTVPWAWPRSCSTSTLSSGSRRTSWTSSARRRFDVSARSASAKTAGRSSSKRGPRPRRSPVKSSDYFRRSSGRSWSRSKFRTPFPVSLSSSSSRRPTSSTSPASP